VCFRFAIVNKNIRGVKEHQLNPIILHLLLLSTQKRKKYSATNLVYIIFFYYLSHQQYYGAYILLKTHGKNKEKNMLLFSDVSLFYMETKKKPMKKPEEKRETKKKWYSRK
jgi:hypothetical protein